MNKLLILFLLVLSSSAQADERSSYIGVQFGTSESSLDNIANDVDLDYGLIRFGIWLDESIALELRSGRGISDEENQGIDLEVERFGGIYGLYHLGIGSNVSVYGAVGWTDGTLKASQGDISIQESDDGLSYGFGAQFAGFNVEFMRYLDTSDITADAVSIGYNYHF